MEQRPTYSEVKLHEKELQLIEMTRQLANAQQQLQEKHEQLTSVRRQLQIKESQLTEMQESLSTAQHALNERQHQESPDWVIPRNHIQLTDKLLGKGGWGKVVEGKYCGCAVAVKTIHELILSPHNRRLFGREMKIASRCRHPCLLLLIGATNDDGSPVFITELMETSLRALMEQRSLSSTEISFISLDVALALNYLHQKQPLPIIHRDISSANVLLSRQGNQWRAKVSDYGTANFKQHTMTVAPGNVIYSAPEALSKSQTVKEGYFGVNCEYSWVFPTVHGTHTDENQDVNIDEEIDENLPLASVLLPPKSSTDENCTQNPPPSADENCTQNPPPSTDENCTQNPSPSANICTKDPPSSPPPDDSNETQPPSQPEPSEQLSQPEQPLQHSQPEQQHSQPELPSHNLSEQSHQPSSISSDSPILDPHGVIAPKPIKPSSRRTPARLPELSLACTRKPTTPTLTTGKPRSSIPAPTTASSHPLYTPETENDMETTHDLKRKSSDVDVYSFGVLLCEMCVRELPDPERLKQQVVMVTNHELRSLIRKCLQLEPEARPSMEEIITELQPEESSQMVVPADESGQEYQGILFPSDQRNQQTVPFKGGGSQMTVNIHNFEVGSMVEVPVADAGYTRYGVIRWIGNLPSINKLAAGLELEEEESACSDGTFHKERYFTCPRGRGFFVLLENCRPDSRFANSSTTDASLNTEKDFVSMRSPKIEGITLPRTTLEDSYCGPMRGLQGHHFSSYLDATLFSMFAFTSVLDTLLHRRRKDNDLEEYDQVQRVLRNLIVNPLRVYGFVRADRLLALRQLLDRLSSTAGLINEAKDPEEFLNALLQQVLKEDPFLHLKPRDVQEKKCEGAFLYQIITDKDETVKIAQVQTMLEQSFISADLFLSEVPSCLILQMPRLRNRLKVYEMILPNLQLDLTYIVENGGRNGYNIPAMKRCPEALEWLSKTPMEIIAAKERGEMPVKVRSLLGDGYLCMYQRLDMTMYS
ncbi:Ubiquitin carboxyl-terminal hydrolase CYLD [Stylophora pistillata]|uniref:ubiquitinyl hydrolase 1 n=1 Tax=Stylophora pistillata TaxID=50429 RepID=A0A2B4RUG2_STYPI|nr:Ubiquitin carboxyl-terminal hydrolase CYLD [Stylophora pistillata]